MLLTYIWWKLFVTRERQRWEGAWGKRKRLKWDTKQRWKENHKRNVSQLPSLMIRMDRTFFITKSMGDWRKPNGKHTKNHFKWKEHDSSCLWCHFLALIFALRILKFGGNGAGWIQSKAQVSSIFRKKIYEWLFVSVMVAAVLCCVHPCSPGPHVGVRAACGGHEACRRWALAWAGWATLQLAAYLEWIRSASQSGRQAGRQKAHPGRGLRVSLFFLNSPPRHTILRSHFFLPQEAQENTIASSLTAKLNPGLLYPARFEKLDITPKSAQKIKPVLERWMAEAEARHRAGMQNLTEFIGSEPSKKRKRRTSFTPQALEILNAHFEKNTHPSGQEMTEIAEKLNYDREVVRVWFCNKRQALKNTIKRLKQHEPATAVPLEPLTDSLEENS